MYPSFRPNPSTRSGFYLLLLALTILTTGRSTAQVVWSAATSVAGDTDVITNGTFLYGYAWGNNNETVNGVSFAGSASTSGASPNVVLTVSTGGINNNTTAFGSVSAAP